MSIAFVFAEPGRPEDARVVANVKHYFPEAIIRWEQHLESVFDESHPRWGWRMNDYHKARLLLDTDADVVVAMDADMWIVSEKVKSLYHLAERFGLCLPANPRKLVSVDTEIGADSDKAIDYSEGTGYAMNCSPIAYHRGNQRKDWIIRTYLDLMRSNPVRGPLAWWRAAWVCGETPYLLPPQWCVCGEDVGIGNEIILHVGHEAVRRHYAALCTP